MVKFTTMWKRFEDKRWGLVLAVLALISLILLAGALRNANFLPARPIIGSDGQTPAVDFSEIGKALVAAGEIPLWKQIVLYGGVLLFLGLIYLFLTPELRKKLLFMFFRLFAVMFMIYYLFRYRPEIISNFLQLGRVGTGPSDAPQGVPPVFEPPQVSFTASYFLTFGFVVLLTLSFWALARWWTGQRERALTRKPLADIAAIARASLREITSGQNSNDAIVQCYVKMSNTLGAKRGLHRMQAMTAAEFASHLEEAGLPREPISKLTGLFEMVRYGGRASGPREIDEAVACLTSILKYCGEIP